MAQTSTLFKFLFRKHTMKLLLLLLFCLAGVQESFGQATLPTTNTNWTTLPTGWKSEGVGTASVDVPSSGSQASSSAYYNTVAETYIQIDFTGVPDKLSFYLRATGFSGTFDGVFQVLEASEINGAYTVVGDDISKLIPSGSQAQYEVIRTLSSTTRSVRLFLKAKGTKHLYLDNATITAAPVGPEINLRAGSTDIKNGGTHNFGTVNLKKSNTVEFTVENNGTSTLRLDPPTLTGKDAGLFSITRSGYAASLEPSQTATFQVTFSPTSLGSYNAEVQIANDDSDENPYRILLQGSGAILKPVITSLSSYVGGVGKEIIIEGQEFINASRVEFSNGVTASFTIISDSQIRTFVPVGAVDGPITVFAGNMSASSELFDVVPTPVISSVTPAEAYELDIVTISGSFLNGATEVVFNGVRTTFTERLDNDGNTVIDAKVPAGATTGPLTVTTLGGTASFNFTVLYKEPTIVSVNPSAAYELEVITITGTYLGSVFVVNFNGIDAAFEVDPESDGTIIYAEVPLGAISGPLTITTSGGTATIDFTVLKPVPAGLTINPTSGKEGSIVIISGANLANATSVVFSGGVEAVFAPITNEDESISLQAQVPVGAQTGPVTVANANGSGSTPTFTVIRPTIIAVDPSAAYELDIVTITGTNLHGATVVNFNGIDAAFEEDPDSDGTIIYAEVPLGATSGPLTVTATDGTASIEFTVLKRVPSNLTINPTSGKVGDYVTISGDNLADATSVVFAGEVSAAFVAIANPDGSTSLQVQVPVGAQTGPVTVANANGSGTTPTFTVIKPVIVITKNEMNITTSVGTANTDNYQVSATNLYDGANVVVDVTALSDVYGVSRNPEGPFVKTLSFEVGEDIFDNTLSAVALWVQFKPTASGNTSTTIEHRSEGATTEVLTVNGSTPVIPLPVELISFKAVKQNSAVFLSWATASERDNDYFDVEMTEDLKGEFKAVGRVHSKVNNSTIRQNYQFTHKGNFTGTRYYRLKQVDLDGTTDYSKVVAVSSNGVHMAIEPRVYPNPIKPDSKLVYTAEEAGKLNVTVMNMSGSRIQSNSYDVEAGENTITLNLSNNLPTGIYILMTELNGKTQQVKLMKQ